MTALGGSLFVTPAVAAQPEPADQPRDQDEMVVTGRYLADSLTRDETDLPLLDTPQSVTVVEDDLMAEQGRRTLRDAMRNVTGISFQAGEGNPPGGSDAFNVRGFSAQIGRAHV